MSTEKSTPDFTTFTTTQIVNWGDRGDPYVRELLDRLRRLNGTVKTLRAANNAEIDRQIQSK